MADPNIGGNTVPRIEKSEHIGEDTGDNIGAKRVVPYDFDLGTNEWIRKGVGYSDFRFDPNDGIPVYIGKNIAGNADTSMTDWVIYKFTYSGSAVTRIQKAVDSWDNRVGAF